MVDNDKISVITEVGDLGLGVDELSEKDQKIYRESQKDSQKQSSTEKKNR